MNMKSALPFLVTGRSAPRTARVLAATAAATTLLLMLACLGSATPSAVAHSPVSNGCTTPIVIPYWNDRFHAQCDTHDVCYNQKWYGSSWTGKAPCDSRFYREMRGNCGWNVVCQGVANRYYAAVRDFGWYAWYNSAWFH